MKILYIDVNYKKGSTGWIVHSLHENCKENGIESSVCYGRGKRIKEDDIFKFGLDLETKIHAGLTRLTGYTGCFSLFSTRRLISYIKRFGPDIVHIHELHAYFVNIKPLLTYLKKNNYKVVFTNHCEFLFTGKCGNVGLCNKFSSICEKCPNLRKYPKTLFFDHTRHMFLQKKKIFDGWDDCVIISPSDWLDSMVGASFLKNKKRFVVHNGIDLTPFKSLNNKIDQEDKTKDYLTIISVAPNIVSDQNKGGKRVIELAKRFENEKIRFLLVGEKNKIRFELPSNVSVLPLVENRSELAKLFFQADLFLICSEFENFPTTCLEAQCSGLQICGFDVGGVKETILEDNGVLVPYGDFDKLENAIRYILSNKKDKEKIRSVAFKEFSNEKMFENYLSIYNSLIS